MSTKLPDGLRCGDCAHMARCNFLLGVLPENYECDFDPPKFENNDDKRPDCDGSGQVTGDYFSEDGTIFCQRCSGKGLI